MKVNKIKHNIKELYGNVFYKRAIINSLFNSYSKVVYRFSKNGYASLPPLIIWVFTLKCNMKCKMCTFYGEHAKQNLKLKNELSYEEIKAVIDDLAKSYKYYPYKPLIGVLGGEPFVRKDILDIMSYLKSKKFRFSITTNFSLMDEENLKGLIKVKPSDLRISLDGPAEIHDEIRGIKGIFDRIYSSIKLLRSLKGGKAVPIRLNCVINDYNIKSLDKMVDIAHNLRADLNFQHLMFVNEKYKGLNKKITESYFGEDLLFGHDMPRIKKEDINPLTINIKKVMMKARKLNVRLAFLPQLKLNEIGSYYLDLDNYRHSKFCTAPWTVGRINNQGYVHPCMDYLYGNIKEGSFKKIWNNKKARYFRKRLKKSRLFPGCVRCCKI